VLIPGLSVMSVFFIDIVLCVAFVLFTFVLCIVPTIDCVSGLSIRRYSSFYFYSSSMVDWCGFT
jgi:hypothetical protein